MSEPGLRLRFEGMAATIAVPDCALFLEAIEAATPGWPFEIVEDDAPPVASVVKKQDSYELRSADMEPLDAQAVSAACGIMVDVLEARIEAEPDRLCLHCGSVEFAGRLVVFPSRSRAGKSTLIARLAASGHRVFGDDVLPLSPGDADGVGTGLAPRLRLPLPERASDDFRAFVAGHEGAADGRYLYLRLPEEQLGKRGETCSLGAIVLLDRRAEGPAFLSDVRRSLVLRELILQNFAQDGPASGLLQRTHDLMDRLPAYALHYSDLDEAAALLETVFAAWPAKAEALAADDPRAEIAMTWEEDQPPDRGGTRTTGRFARCEGVELRSVAGEAFLAGGEADTIHQLNPLGSAIWTLLDEPQDVAEIGDVLSQAFPDVPAHRITADVSALFADLLAAGLIERR